MSTRQAKARPSVVYPGERRLRINAPADTVWRYMADVRRRLRLNIFHAAVEYPEPVVKLTEGPYCVPVEEAYAPALEEAKVE